MRLSEIKKLHRDDEVWWNDPDGGARSKVIRILTIQVHGEIIQIVGMDASYLECYASELLSNIPDEIAFSC